MPDDDLAARVGFSFAPSIGARRMRRIEDAFGSPAQAWHASARDLRAAGLPDDAVQEIEAARRRLDPAAELERLAEVGVDAIAWNDPRYPELLQRIADPPPLLYLHGELAAADQRAIAIVGTRRPTPYGARATRNLARDLSAAGLAVVSGLALGVDALAHRAALEAHGRTIAVVAGGLDRISPRQNLPLAAEIVDAGAGAIISEHPLGLEPSAESFARRNRILAGLSLGALVTEAGVRSGAWHTVTSALDYDREVFAVPGPIDAPQSEGANRMLQQGLAKLVLSAADVLVELPTGQDAPGQAGQAPLPMPAPAEGDSIGRSA